METFESVRKDGRLLYEYVRGSHLYGLNNEDSDVDTSGVFIAKHDDLLDMGLNFQDQISDERHDTTWYEIGKFITMLTKSNPSVLESLFIPEDKIITKPSPALNILFENRDEFITKQCFDPFVKYAFEQIRKARGLNKKIVNPVYERLTPFDFAYTFYKQGSTKIGDWLENRGLKKEFCGLVHVPNMHDTYGVYYDWGAHFEAEGIKSSRDFMFMGGKALDFAINFYGLLTKDESGHFHVSLHEWFENHKEVLHYRGMCLDASTELRCSSVAKGEKPLCQITYNESGFKDHCRKYKEYKDWEKERNPKRYQSNLDKNYDSKNMMHCFRLMHMASEIAEGKGMILKRTWDRQFLMDVRDHKYEYEEIIERLEEEKARMNQLMEQSTIREMIDTDFVNQLTIDIRRKLLGM